MPKKNVPAANRDAVEVRGHAPAEARGDAPQVPVRVPAVEDPHSGEIIPPEIENRKIGSDVLLICADARRIPLPDESVQCVVTSPPYWGLRKYKGEQELIWGGDVNCGHEWFSAGNGILSQQRDNSGGLVNNRLTSRGTQKWTTGTATSVKRGDTCSCGAWRGAYGLEPTVEMYVAHTVEILREIRRVLRPDGVVFWNIGDSYAGSWGNFGGHSRGNGRQREITVGSLAHQKSYDGLEGWHPPTINPGAGLKPKDLCLIPERVALAAQADGWWVRSLIIWAKPNPMPESVTDRPTDAYEHILMLTRSERYFWDAEAVREPQTGNAHSRGTENGNTAYQEARGSYHGFRSPSIEVPGGRNLRNVWTFPTQPYSGAHFATFPEEIPRRCILAATSARGACSSCGAPWKRIVESKVHFEGGSGLAMSRDPESWHGSKFDTGKTAEHQGQRMQLRSGKYEASEQAESGDYDIRMGPVVESKTIGWEPTCKCGTKKTLPCLALDPFGGSGTTGRVAIELNRRAVLLDLAYASKDGAGEYATLARERTSRVQRQMFG